MHACSVELKRRTIYLCLLAAVLSSVMFLHAQEYRGLILGQVTDPSGAVVPNATIKVVGPQQTYTAKTNANGDFTIPYVQPGVYEVTAEATGFRKELHPGINVDVAQKINLNFRLQVGTTTETVTVEADAVAVNTADASGGTVIDPQKMQNIPLNGRQMYMLMNLTPGVRFTSTVAGATGQSGTRGWDETNAYVINGVQMGYNQFTLNGAPITQQNASSRGSWEISPNVDAVEEFKVMTNTYDAQYGRSGGGTINTILKSGTNNFHGTAFDFWRNSIFDANSYQFNQRGMQKPFHNQHQFGGTFGGPIQKGKTYFFGSLEAWREVMPVPIVTTVPTPDLRPRADGSVDFSGYIADQNKNGLTITGIYDPLTATCVTVNKDGTCKTYNRAQFPGNIIPASRISPAALKILALYPSPNNPGTGYSNNYIATNPGRYSYNQPIVRVDHNFSDNTRMYGMFAWWGGREYRNGSGMPGPAANGNINNYRSNLTQVIDVTHTFSSKLFADWRFSFNRSWNVTPDGSVAAGLAKLTAADLGLTMPQIPTTNKDYAPEISVSGFPTIIGNSTTGKLFETYETSPSISHVVGHHNLHYGFQYMLMHSIPSGIGNPNGTFSFNGSWTQKDPAKANKDGVAWASFLLGYPSGGGVDWNQTVYESYPYYATYIQDDWKLRHNLTLNLGLRWDVETSPRDRNNYLNAGMCMTCVNPVTSLITFPANNLLPNGATMVNPILGGYQFASSKLSAYDTQWNHWQPRIGVAWGINHKTVLRGGWGINQAFGTELGGSSTWTQSTDYNTSYFGPNGASLPNDFFKTGNPFPNGVLAPIGSSQGLMTGIGSTQYFDQRNRKIPQVQQYSLGIQRELPAKIILDVSFVGSYTKQLRVGTNYNHLTPEQFAAGNANNAYLDQPVPNPFYCTNPAVPYTAACPMPRASSLGGKQTIAAKYLMYPYPQYYGTLYAYTEPVGYSNYNSLAVKVEKKVSGGGLLINGLSFLTSFTYSRTMVANGYLNNGNLADPRPYYGISDTDRPLDLAFSGVWGLPVGKGGLIGKDAHGIVGQMINNWTVDWIFTADSGTPTGIPGTYFYNCNNGNYAPAHKKWTEWLYNENPSSCFTVFPSYTPITVLPRSSHIRNPYVPTFALAFAKQFEVREGMKLQYKAEAFNLTNTPLFGGPSTSNPDRPLVRQNAILDGQPGSWTGYGTIGSTQQNLPRQLQMSLKLIF